VYIGLVKEKKYLPTLLNLNYTLRCLCIYGSYAARLTKNKQVSNVYYIREVVRDGFVVSRQRFPNHPPSPQYPLGNPKPATPPNQGKQRRFLFTIIILYRYIYIYILAFAKALYKHIHINIMYGR